MRWFLRRDGTVALIGEDGWLIESDDADPDGEPAERDGEVDE